MSTKKMTLYKAIIIFQGGLSEDALLEIQNLLNNLWLKKNYKPFLTLEKNRIYIANIHIDSLFEIVLRCPFVSDVRIVIHESLVKSKSNLKTICDEIDWSSIININHEVNIKVDSIASQLFHEGAIKEVVLSSKLQNYIPTKTILEDKTSNNLYFEILKNKLTVAFSLSGKEIYKRNYKSSLIANAPLREDLAYYCIKKLDEYFFEEKKRDREKNKITMLFVPFGGSGTFVFEYLNLLFHFSNDFFSCTNDFNKYNFELTSLFKDKTWGFLNKKSLQETENVLPQLKSVIYMDNLPDVTNIFKDNFNHFVKLIEEKSEGISKKIKNIELRNELGDFLKLDVQNFLFDCSKNETVFMPLNPPYGIRLQSNRDSAGFYSKISEKLNEIGLFLNKKGVNLCVLILCPTKETWSVSLNKLKTKSTQTIHFTQGGQHIRGLMADYTQRN